MRFLNEYAVSIIVMSLLSLLLENLLPEGSHKKYTGLLIGLLVMLVILKPITRLPANMNTLYFSLPSNHNNVTIPPLKPYVAENFEKNLANTISDDLFKNYGTSVSCRVQCETNESGQITGIQRVLLHPHTTNAAKYIAEKYGIEEAKITS